MSKSLPFTAEVPASFKGLRATVMGLGRFGGGVGAARFLAEQGARVTVTDLKPLEALTEPVRTLSDLDISWVLGTHPESLFTEADLVVVNPAVPNTSKYLDLAVSSNVLLEREINLFCKLCPAKVIGITGTNGKTTTTRMMTQILSASRRVWEGGNIGASLLPKLDCIKKDDIVVLELSSFQLEGLDAIRWSPHIALITNCTPNHLDRYEDFADYACAKAAILRHQQAQDATVINAEDSEVISWPVCEGVRSFTFSQEGPANAYVRDGWIFLQKDKEPQKLMRVKDLGVPGRHMRMNALAAALASNLGGASTSDIAGALQEFRGLPHRLERVGAAGGISFYNDSKATTPESACAAIAAFEQPVILIAGGYDKQVSLRQLAEAVVTVAAIQGAVLIGETAETLEREIKALAPTFPVQRCRSLEDACQAAVDMIEPDGVVLFSPACASYDMFSNYEARGEAFCKWARQWIEASGAD